MSGCGAKNGERLQTRSMVEPWVPGAMSRHECICFLFVFLCHVQHTSVSKLDGCTTTMTGTESSWKCINLGHLRTWTLNDIDAFCACLLIWPLSLTGHEDLGISEPPCQDFGG